MLVIVERVVVVVVVVVLSVVTDNIEEIEEIDEIKDCTVLLDGVRAMRLVLVNAVDEEGVGVG